MTRVRPANTSSTSSLLRTTIQSVASDLPIDTISRIANAIESMHQRHEANKQDAPEDVFFRRLDEARAAESTTGIHWSDLPMQFGLALQCAQLDHCVSGLHGLLELLHADESACASGQAGLGGDLTERLFYASRALASSARMTLQKMIEHIGSAQV
ncbi:hypothetical protein CFBP498_08170 [Xanthomonas hortorum pv. vitians]|uniref:Uncharacterized protein n=1 Tax=Xanthomonas hortorum pv. vitians TaxID=83224 RepID=A0A6V7BZT6_9XANT|nr:hypothetical protein XHV734_4996 [Xanthomonas hortorum pv. vitians]CAD0307628.1 hypothetical protein CFBP498_08170 [Xanthomonas hortorum pv. vitians]CAD0307634.1 hypothetical protein CFBP498_08170 [Xanthomonas hortorum pv. vitians]